MREIRIGRHVLLFDPVLAEAVQLRHIGRHNAELVVIKGRVRRLPLLKGHAVPLFLIIVFTELHATR